MGKRKRREAHRAIGADSLPLRSPAPSLAERHTFTGGMLGHDPGSPWTVGEVGEIAALGVDAIYSAVVAIADAASRCRWGEWRGNLELPPSRLVLRPMATRTRREWTWEVAATLALYNVAVLRELGGRDSEGVPFSLQPIAPPRVSAVAGETRVDGEPVDPAELHYIRRTVWPTVSPALGSLLRLARDTFAAASSATGYAADWWENGGAPIVVLSTDQELTDPVAEYMATRWRERRAQGPSYPAVLGKGLEASAFGANLDSSGAALDRLLAAIARYFRLPPHVINAPAQAGALTYVNTAHADLELVKYTVSAYTEPIADAISDLLPGFASRTRECRLDTRVLTEADQLTRYQALQVAVGGPWMTPDEARESEGFPPRELVPPRAEPIEVAI